MAYDKKSLERIFARTDGCCHICRKPLAFSNYGQHGSRGAWEVEHSNPRAKGGTDRTNNLYASHTTCNRQKRAKSTRSARAGHGFRSAPLSREQRQKNAVSTGTAGALLATVIVPPQFRLAAAFLSGIAGAVLGWEHEPE